MAGNVLTPGYDVGVLKDNINLLCCDWLEFMITHHFVVAT